MKPPGIVRKELARFIRKAILAKGFNHELNGRHVIWPFGWGLLSSAKKNGSEQIKAQWSRADDLFDSLCFIYSFRLSFYVELHSALDHHRVCDALYS